MHKPNQHSVHHPGPLPHPSSTSSQLLCRVRWKWSESSETSLRITGSPSSDGSHDRLGDVAVRHLFLVHLLLYIIFCLYKTGPRKKKKTQHITSFLFFLPKPGEKKQHVCTIAYHTKWFYFSYFRCETRRQAADGEHWSKRLSFFFFVYWWKVIFSLLSLWWSNFIDPKWIRCQHFSKKNINLKKGKILIWSLLWA